MALQDILHHRFLQTTYRVLAGPLTSSPYAHLHRTFRNDVIHPHTIIVVTTCKHFTNHGASRAVTGKVKMDNDGLKSCLRLAPDGSVTLAVHAKPGAKKSAITGTLCCRHVAIIIVVTGTTLK